MIYTANPATLAAALKAAKSGDVIQLAPGDYAMPSINGLAFDLTNPLTIVAQPGAPALPALHGLKIANASGIVFDGFELVTYDVNGMAVDPYYAFRLTNCHGLTFRNLFVHGDPAKPPAQQINGFYPSLCSGLLFTDNTFENLCAAINAQKSPGLHILHNFVTGLNKGGFEIGGCSDVTIADNFITNFQSAPGIHGDAVQIFTFGETAAAKNINVTGNLYTRGANGIPAQGIFIQDETKSLPFSNVNISNNCILGGEWDSIMLNGISGVAQITANVVATWPGPDPVGKLNPDGSYPTTNFNGYLRVGQVAPGTVINLVDNQFQQYILNGTNAPAPAGNTVLGAVTDGGAALEAAWRKAHAMYRMR